MGIPAAGAVVGIGAIFCNEGVVIPGPGDCPAVAAGRRFGRQDVALFAVARMAGWAAHRMEELISGGRIIRPAYKSVSLPGVYTPITQRTEAQPHSSVYVPTEERI